MDTQKFAQARHEDSKRVAKDSKTPKHINIVDSLLYNLGGGNYISLHKTDSLNDIVVIFLHDSGEWKSVSSDKPLNKIADDLVF